MLTRYVPQFIALSAASPFYQGQDTSFQSSRLTAVSAFPLAGHMPFVRDWAGVRRVFREDEGLRHRRQHEGLLLGHPPQARVRHHRNPRLRHAAHRARAAALAAYAQAIAAYHLAERPREPTRAVYLVNSYNRFEACRYGLRGELVEPWESRKKKIGEDILDTVAAVMPHARNLGCADALAELAGGVRRGYSDAGWLRERLGATGALAAVVRQACELWEERG